MARPWLAWCVALAGLTAGPAAAQLGAPPRTIHPGDRILLRVTGEPTLTDTFTVGDGTLLDLPVLGTVPLDGVLRDSIEPHLTRFLAQYLNHPVVRAQVLLRIGVLGEVARPGFYALPAGALLEDLVMAGGGLSRDARFERAKVVREGAVLFQGDSIQRAIAGGRTLDALALRSGDALQVPRRPDQEGRMRILSALVALPIAVYGLVRLF